MPQDKKIVISGNQEEDLDAAAMARVVIALARAWLEQHETPKTEQDGDTEHGS